jgi:arylsulfatase A-like enzyme
MTGWYPHVHGHRSMRNMLKEYEPSLLSVLRCEGYFTWWGGKNDLVSVKEWDDYAKYVDVKYRGGGFRTGHRNPEPLAEDDRRHGAYYAGVLPRDEEGEATSGDAGMVAGAVDVIRNRPRSKPLCVFLPLGFPHPAYHAHEEHVEKIFLEKLPPRIPVPEDTTNMPAVMDDLREQFEVGRISEEDWREVKRVYYGMCTQVDHLFGQVVEALKDTGEYDNSLIIVLSDHGDFTGDYSLPEKTHSTLQDSLLRVPFIIKPPKGIEVAPGIREHLAELVDMPATIYDLLGIEPGYDCQGVSLRGSLAGSEEEIHTAVFAEVGGRRAEPGFVNTEVNAMPPRSFYGRQSQAAIPHHEAGSYAVMCRTHDYKYVRRGYTDCFELYDLKNDPGETVNLSGRPEMVEVERKMETRLLNWFMETGDILHPEPDSRRV